MFDPSPELERAGARPAPTPDDELLDEDKPVKPLDELDELEIKTFPLLEEELDEDVIKEPLPEELELTGELRFEELEEEQTRKSGLQSSAAPDCLQQSGKSEGNPSRQVSKKVESEQVGLCPLVQKTIPPEQYAPLEELDDELLDEEVLVQIR